MCVCVCVRACVCVCVSILSDKVLEWFKSYLKQCSQRVSVHGILSDVQLLLSGVPQGSVLDLWFYQCTHALLCSMHSDMVLNIAYG